MKLSIITINLNNKTGLEKSILSVINQSFTDYEFIIIDGKSSDGSEKLYEKYKNNIAYYISEQDEGIYHAMNKGIEKAKGEYLFFLNSGDSLTCESILEQVFNKPHSEDILYGNLIVWENNKKKGIATTPESITLDTLYNNTIHHQAAFIKGELFSKFGSYNLQYQFRSDWEFWIRTVIINNCTTQYLNLEIANYNYDGITAQKENEEKILQETKSILQSYFPGKVLIDYEINKRKTTEYKIFDWITKHKLLYSFNKLIYSMSTKFYKLFH